MKHTALVCCALLNSFGLAAAPTFRIMPVYEGVARYLQAREAEPDAAPLELYRRHVGEPYRECDPTPSPMMFMRAPNYLVELEQAVQTLRDAQVERLVQRALERSAAHLPVPGTVEVCVGVLDPNNSFVREGMNGVTGRAGERIVLEVYPRPGWRSALAYITAHEYHHIVMFRRYVDLSRPADLLDALLIEGRADVFARQVYPNVTAPWADALSRTQERERWARMKADLASTDWGLIHNWLFGESVVPSWTGYTVGFRIMEAFLQRHPDVDVQAWSALDARAILRASGYEPE